jgi:hypothetical protein
MPLSWNEIRTRAVAFSKEWAGESSEDAEAKSFWDGFLNVFGITRRRVASFETPVKKSDGHGGYIDLLWKGVLLVEHKSRGKDLTRAFRQALDYFPGLRERDLPRYVLVSDFARFRLYDLETETPLEFPIVDLHKNVRHFGFVAGYQTRSFGQQDPVNVKAAEKLGRLHDLLKESGYCGHELEVFLVRLLFCLFAEDTSIFYPRQFGDYLTARTVEGGSDLGMHLANLFEVLNTPEDKRQSALDEHLKDFPYVNGRLFEERLPMAAFDRTMRETLFDCAALDWSRISPAIFGSLFQSIMDETARRNIGAHYTTETNILKALRPLFLDSLRAEFERIRRDRNRLQEFHRKLTSLRILDPGRVRQLPGHRLQRIAPPGNGGSAGILQASTDRLLGREQHRPGGRGPILRHRDLGIPGPNRPGRPVAHGPSDKHARIRGVRAILRSATFAEVPAHCPRERAVIGLEVRRAAGVLIVHRWESAV